MRRNQHKNLQLVSKISPTQTSIIENVKIEVTINNTPTVIIAAYSPKFTQHFENDIQALIPSNKQFMIFGDLNAKHTSWNCNTNNTAGCKLFALQQSHEFLIFHTPEHTHHPHSGQNPSAIDLLLTNVNFAFDLSTHADQMSSDHVPIICTTLALVNKANKIHFDFSKANWRKYRQNIDSNAVRLPSPTTCSEIDSIIKKFTEIILLSRDKCIPTKLADHRPQISKFANELITMKNTIQRQCQRTNCPIQKRILKQIVNKYQKKYQ